MAGLALSDTRMILSGALPAALGELGRQVAYKCARRRKRLVLVGRFFASSKRCHACGWVRADLTLADRTWMCGGCGVRHERDANAALNIKQQGLRMLAAGPP